MDGDDDGKVFSSCRTGASLRVWPAYYRTVAGIWLLIGIQLRYCLYASLTLMAILVLGSSSIENWSAIEAQLVHGMYLFGLLWYYEAKTKDREGN